MSFFICTLNPDYSNTYMNDAVCIPCTTELILSLDANIFYFSETAAAK